MSKENFRFQAHRGDSAFYPENTLVSYKAAIDEGYHVIEMDNKFTKDGVCICLHDGTVNRTCRRDDGSVIEEKTSSEALTLEEIKALDAGMFKGEEFTGTRIPTMAEALAFIRDNSNLTVKLDNVFQSFNEQKFETFCSVIRDANMEERIGFTCKTFPYLYLLSQRFPKAEMHYDGSLTPDVLNFIGDKLRDRATIWIPYDNKATSWCRERKASVEFCRDLHQYGKVGIWVISEVSELDDAVNLFGADIIETNGTLKPDALRLV